tara:strand:+ start:510 stop:611 length:102 start_codon:yes stop_codon:yes gene_type:complete
MIAALQMRLSGYFLITKKKFLKKNVGLAIAPSL